MEECLAREQMIAVGERLGIDTPHEAPQPGDPLRASPVSSDALAVS